MLALMMAVVATAQKPMNETVLSVPRIIEEVRFADIFSHLT
jgi:hypothetical protein